MYKLTHLQTSTQRLTRPCAHPHTLQSPLRAERRTPTECIKSKNTLFSCITKKKQKKNTHPHNLPLKHTHTQASIFSLPLWLIHNIHTLRLRVNKILKHSAPHEYLLLSIHVKAPGADSLHITLLNRCFLCQRCI